MATSATNAKKDSFKDSIPPAEGQLLLKDSDVAELLSVSVRSVWRLNSSHRMPPPIRLAGNVRWRLSDIKEWVDVGCPDHDN
jgi:predicted DNA-binding transcriptional regulator AlpA